MEIGKVSIIPLPRAKEYESPTGIQPQYPLVSIVSLRVGRRNTDTPPVSFQYPLVSISIFYPQSAKEYVPFTDTNRLYLPTLIRVGWWGGGVSIKRYIGVHPYFVGQRMGQQESCVCNGGGGDKDTSDNSENGKSLQ